MDEDRQANFEERHQRKMQHEYRKIEKEAMRKHPSVMLSYLFTYLLSTYFQRYLYVWISGAKYDV